jgi:serine/threonine-protein kinase HipA
LSLPFLPGNAPYQGQVVTNYFGNLLPDNDAIRRRLAQRHRAGGTDAFQLLAKLGRDCVGAIQLLPEDEAPSDLYEINGEALNLQGSLIDYATRRRPKPWGSTMTMRT